MSSFSPQRVFLGWQAPALELVAERLLQWSQEAPSLFRRALVVVPTEESGRRLRERLAEKAERQALLIPRICLSGALTSAPHEASTLETLAAWLAVLAEESPARRWPRLFPVPPRSLFNGGENAVEKSAEDNGGEIAAEKSAEDYGGEVAAKKSAEAREGEGASPAWGLPVAQQFIALRRQLEQAGLTPAHVVRHLRSSAGSPGIPDEEEARWQEMEELFAAVDEHLRSRGYHPAEEARQKKRQHARWPHQTPFIILACLPHVSLQTRRFLARLPREQGRIEAWIHAPQSHADHFDDWGQPGEYWSRCPIPVSDHALHVLPDADALAEQALRLLEGVPSEQAVLGVCDPDMLPALHTAFHAQGWPLYLPEGRHPLTSDLPRLASEWVAATAPSAGAADLVQLLRNTAFQQLCGLEPSQQQPFCELLDAIEQNYLPDQTETLLHYLQKASRGELAQADATAGAAAQNVLRACRLLLPSVARQGPDALPDGLTRLLEALSDLRTGADADAQAALACAQELLRLRRSRLAPSSRDAFCALMRHHFSTLRPPTPPRSTTVLDALGWMELTYAPGQRVVLTGLHEGCVPEAPATDAYLPDSLRQHLGMDCHARRVERDSFLLCALLASHPGQVDLLVARHRDDGSILPPSSLLTRCPEAPPEALPHRVQQLFMPLDIGRRTLPFERGGWLIGAPDAALRQLSHPPARHLPSDGMEPISLITGSLPHPWGDPAKPLSPSALNNFLACPLRFWLSRVLHLDPSGAVVEDKSSLQARDYGSLLHDVLRDLAADFPRWLASLTAAQLASRAEELLQRRLHSLFGTRPPIAILVQQERMQDQLRRFARLHGQSLQEGWEVLSLEEAQNWTWRNIPLTVRPDRVDRHRDGSLRLIDYKTSATLPRKAHLKRLTPEAAALCEAFLPSFPLLKEGKNVYRVVNVQLPLYAAWAEERYGSLPAMLYVNLPRKKGPVAFNSFDITPEERDILLTHAEEAARLIRSGLCLYSAESLGDEAFTTFGQLAPDGDLRAMVGLPPLALPSDLPPAASPQP